MGNIGRKEVWERSCSMSAQHKCYITFWDLHQAQHFPCSTSKSWCYNDDFEGGEMIDTERWRRWCSTRTLSQKVGWDSLSHWSTDKTPPVVPQAAELPTESKTPPAKKRQCFCPWRSDRYWVHADLLLLHQSFVRLPNSSLLSTWVGCSNYESCSNSFSFDLSGGSRISKREYIAVLKLHPVMSYYAHTWMTTSGVIYIRMRTRKPCHPCPVSVT